MGILEKKLVVFIANLTKNCKSSKKQIIMSCVSLFLATMILFSSVYCWMYLQEAKTLGTFSVNAENGLRLNYNNNNSSVVQITKNMNFLPASSVNGQNIYFPSDGSFFTQESLEDKTKEITYRSATAGDKNVFFLQFDFTLTSYTPKTQVFIDDKETYIRIKDSTVPLSAMRVAFLYDNGTKSVVMNPTKLRRESNAVDVVNFGTGICLGTKSQEALPFSSYTASGGNQLFTLGENETQTMSVVIWLEGTDKDCVNNVVIGKNLDINIKFTTTWNNMDDIIFRDVSNDKWITNLINSGGKLELVYTDPSNGVKPYVMTGANGQYTCKIQKTIENGITFKLRDKDGTQYIWQKEPDLDSGAGGGPSTYRGKNVIYHAKGTKGDPRGYWKTTDDDNDIGTDTPEEEW